MSYREITIGARTQFVVKVSAEDYDYLMQWRWTFARSHGRWSGLIYARRCAQLDGIKTTILMHKDIIIKRMGIARPSANHFVDHTNGDSLDCRRINDSGGAQLRWLTPAENMAARRYQANVNYAPPTPDAIEAAIAETF